MKAPLESQIQNTICEYLALRRYFFWRANTAPIFNAKYGAYRAMPKFSLTGVPDIILIREGIFWGLEVKRPKTYQSDNQKEFERLCKENGAQYHIVRSLDDVISLGL